VADDGRVAEQSLDVPLAELGDGVRLEVRERSAERLALAQDRQPGQPGLEPLETKALVNAPLGRDRPAPLLIVVGEVERVAGFPAADEVSQRLPP
jgi:hypothetical protein